MSCATQTMCGKGEKISEDTNTAERTCSVCDAGKHQAASGHRYTSCTPCPAGTMNDDAASAPELHQNCIACDGTVAYSDDTGLTACKSCPSLG